MSIGWWRGLVQPPEPISKVLPFLAIWEKMHKNLIKGVGKCDFV